MKKNRVDCVATKRKIQEKLYAELRPRSIRDYCDKIKALAGQSELWRALRKNRNSGGHPVSRGKMRIAG